MRKPTLRRKQPLPEQPDPLQQDYDPTLSQIILTVYGGLCSLALLILAAIIYG